MAETMMQEQAVALTQATDSGLSADVLRLDDARPLWDNFLSEDLFGAAQTLSWASNWARTVNPEIAVGVVRDGSRPVLLLPLEIITSGGARIARYIGGTHANANFPVMRNDAAAPELEAMAPALCDAFKRFDPKLDALVLTRQIQEMAGHRNPMLALTSIESPNLALSFVINSDFETLIKDRSGARKLKKMRQQARRMDERGGWRCAVARDADASDMFLQAFFVMKAKRFQEFGLKDTFEAPQIKAFFQALFAEPQPGPEIRYQLDGLLIGGEVLAVAGSTVRHNCILVEFGAVRAHEPTLSPGDFLFHQMIMKACEDRIGVFDFGVGDEHYKRSWCDVETRHADSFAGFSGRGKALVLALILAGRAKLAIKRSRRLSGLLKKWRMRGAAPAE